MYGLNPARTRYLPAKGINPPFRKLWRYTERPLLEFPPIYVGGKLYAINNNGTAFALDAKTGKPVPSFGKEGRIDVQADLRGDPDKISAAVGHAPIVYKDNVIIAGRTGESLPAAPGDLTLVYRVSSMRDAVFRRELEELAARRQAKVWFVAGTRSELDGDPLTGGDLARRVPDLVHHDVYLSGPPGLAAAVTRELRAAGVSRRQIHDESFEF